MASGSLETERSSVMLRWPRGLQALVQPDIVAIGPTTRRLIGDLFDYRDLGAIEVGGLAGPAPAWQVLRASAIESRFEALRGAT